MKIRNGYGYYAIDHYPIGGSFHRAGTHGLPIAEITRTWDKQCHGCNAEGLTLDGKRVAFNLAHVDKEGAA